MSVTIVLNADQVGRRTITLTDAQLTSIAQQQASAPTQQPQPQPPQPQPQPTVGAAFVAPPAVVGRAQMKTDMKWQNGPSMPAPAPLTDDNVWLIGFTCGGSQRAEIATAEYQGESSMRNYALVRNRDGAILSHSVEPMQTPAVLFGAPISPLDHRVQLIAGERYTLAVWNAVPNVASRMIAQMMGNFN